METKPTPLVYFRAVHFNTHSRDAQIDHETTPSIAIDPQYVIGVQYKDTIHLNDGSKSAYCRVVLSTGVEFLVLGSLRAVLERLGR